jgi:hypothetical protein
VQRYVLVEPHAVEHFKRVSASRLLLLHLRQRTNALRSRLRRPGPILDFRHQFAQPADGADAEAVGFRAGAGRGSVQRHAGDGGGRGGAGGDRDVIGAACRQQGQQQSEDEHTHSGLFCFLLPRPAGIMARESR